MKRLIIFVMLAMLFLTSFTGCSVTVDERSVVNYNSDKGDVHMTQTAELLMKKLKIDDDCAIGAAEKLYELGINIKSVKKVRSKRGITAMVKDESSNKYYLGFSELGYLEIIRKNKINGEVIFAYID